MFRGKPVVLLCGDGGSGKDTVATALSRRWSLPYSVSTSYVAARLMWPQIQEGRFCSEVRHERVISCPYPRMEGFNFRPDAFRDLLHFYDERTRHRRFWSEWIDCYNDASESKAQLYLDSVKAGNHILTGIRKVRELDAFLQTAVPDLAIWIDRPGIPRDPTQEYGPERCDLVLRNDGDLDLIRDRITRISNFLVGLNSGGWEE
jgi:hypothetical protein